MMLASLHAALTTSIALQCPFHPFPAEWQQLHAGGGKGARAALLGAGAGASTAMHVQVDNRLGVEAAMELDFGDHL
jgi:hypothetical protein